MIKIKEWLILSGLTTIVLLMLLWQAKLPAWRDHLQTDVVTFFNRSYDFWLNGSLGAIKYNEYQPGALLFFLLPGLQPEAHLDFYTYESIFFGLNLFLIWLHFFVYKLQRSFLNVLSFIMIIAFGGPILLFRFELLVSLITLLSFYFWGRQRQVWALILLGAAASIKIYPLLFLPYYLILRRPKLKELMVFLVSFSTGLLTPVLLTLSLGMTGQQLLNALAFHALKPVGIEGFPAMILVFLNKLIYGFYPQIYGAYGVNGLLPAVSFLSLTFYNYFWVMPVFFFYYLLWRKRKSLIFNYKVPFLLILLFLIFSKGLNPQYLFWFVFFFPLIKINKDYESYFLGLALILISLFLTQLIYPLAYTQFLQDFYTSSLQVELFYLNSLRNFLLIVLFISLFKQTFLKKQFTD